MPQYVLNKDFVHHSTLGHSIGFKKGVPTFVPKICEREVMRFGAELAEAGDAPDLLDAPTNDVPVPMEAEDRRELIEEAFAEIVAKNDSGDFTAAQVPRVPAVEKIVGFDVDVKEVNALWAEYKTTL